MHSALTLTLSRRERGPCGLGKEPCEPKTVQRRSGAFRAPPSSPPAATTIPKKPPNGSSRSTTSAGRGRARAQFLLERLKRTGLPPRRAFRLQRDDALRQHHPRRPAARRIPGDREIERRDQEHHPLERHGDGRAGEQARARASAATFRPSPRPPRSTKSPSTTSSTASKARSRPTRSFSRATPRRASTPGRFCWAGSSEQQLKNFRRELAARRRAVVAIRIPG